VRIGTKEELLRATVRELIEAQDAHEAADSAASRAVFADAPDCDEALLAMDAAAARLDAAWAALRRSEAPRLRPPRRSWRPAMVAPTSTPKSNPRSSPGGRS
jgi:hypothetical protein